MKKSMLLAMPMLTASPELKQAAMADEPKKETTYYGHTYTTRTYFAYMNCLVQDGILKAAFFLPDHLRLDGNNPVYEVFLDKENRQFLTYDHLEKKWRDAKLDRLEWHGRNYYATCWVSEEDAALVQDYFSGERGGALGILDFQRNVRDEQLERRHKRITDPWDQDLAQVPELPKDWAHWADKVAVRENFIFYHYKRGGAKTGYCTFCGKEVPISGHPYHNKEGRCIRCRHPVVFKALGRAGYFQTDKYYAYLVQRCRDGFVVREFRAERIPCRTASPIGMSSGVRFMTAPAKSVPITGGCTASGKHAGSREAPAITLIMVINPAGYMERLCPAWRKKNFVKPAWPSGYEAIRSLILKNTWQSGKGFPTWSRSGRLDCSG